MKIKKWLQSILLGTAIALSPKNSQANKLEYKLKPKVQLIKNNNKPSKLEKIILPEKKQVTYNTQWWEYLIYIPTAYLSTVLVHESGHAITAKAMGYKKIKFHKPSMDTITSVSYKFPHLGYQQSKIEKDLISAAGVTATTLGNITLTSLLKYNSIPKKLKPFVATTSLMMMMDRWRYIFSTALKFGFKQEITNTNDVHKIVSNRIKSRKNQAITYGILTGLTALEIGLRYPEIKYLFNTMAGKKTEYKKNNLYMMTNIPNEGNGIILELKGKF